MAKKNGTPQAESVEFMGLCPCGCGAYKAMLIDEDENFLASFGWDREGWVRFMDGVLKQIDGESNDGTPCEAHRAH